MGASKRESEKMTYTLHTIPLTVEEFEFYFSEHIEFIKEDWTAELNDYDTYKNDTKYKEISKEVFKLNKLRDNIKQQVRNNNQLNKNK